MGNRNYKYSRRNRSYPQSYDDQPGLGESVGYGIAEGIAAFIRGIMHGVRRIFRSGSNLPSPKQIKIANRRPFLFTRQSPHLARTYRNLPYQKTPGVVTAGEQAIWSSLERAVQGKHRLFCKVRLADIICCPHENSHEGFWFRKISRYHVDFVVCDPLTTAPLLVIELDDRLHREDFRRKQDDFKDTVLRAAGLPIYRITAQGSYDVAELKQGIGGLINRGAATGRD